MSTSLKLVYDHPVFSEQKGWRQSSCDKILKIKQVDSLSTLQMEGLHYLTYMLQ